MARLSRLACVSLALLLTLSVEAAASANGAGFVLLREGIGARASGMGDAYTAVTGDQTGAFWNPATVSALGQKDFVLAYQRSIQGINQTYGGWAYGNGRRGIALSLAMYSAGDIEARNGPSAEPLGTFGLTDATAGLTYAQQVGVRWRVGATVRALHESLGPERASGLAADFGLLFYPGIPGITLGSSYRNLGRTERLDLERIPLPRTFRLGCAYERERLTVSMDVRVPHHGPRGLNAGIEYQVHEALTLRGGYQSGHDTRDVAFGIGLRRKNWRIDYAFVRSKLGLESGHRLTLGIR